VAHQAYAQLRELPAAHHLQQLNGEFNLRIPPRDFLTSLCLPPALGAWLRVPVFADEKHAQSASNTRPNSV
jgi:ribosomal protein L1